MTSRSQASAVGVVLRVGIENVVEDGFVQDHCVACLTATFLIKRAFQCDKPAH